jgi:regulatory protein
LKRLIELKFLNDKTFASEWTRSRQKNKGKSRFLIKQELKLKGVAEDTIEETLSASEDDFETAKILFEKKKKLLATLQKEKFKQKMAGYLSRRGYSFEVINKLFKETES